jgi:hypothetical protein
MLNMPLETIIVAEWLALLFFIREVPNLKFGSNCSFQGGVVMSYML